MGNIIDKAIDAILECESNITPESLLAISELCTRAKIHCRHCEASKYVMNCGIRMYEWYGDSDDLQNESSILTMINNAKWLKQKRLTKNNDSV